MTPFDASGTFIPLDPPEYPAVVGEVIRASHYNAVVEDIFGGLELLWTMVSGAGATPEVMAYRGAIASSSLDTATANGFYRVDYGTHSTSLLVWTATGATAGPVQMEFDRLGVLRWRNQTDGSSWTAWKTIYHTGNINTLTFGDSQITSVSAGKLTVGDGTVGGDLRSSNFVAGTSGWRVRPDGSAEFRNATVRGDVLATSITGQIVGLANIEPGATSIVDMVSVTGTTDTVSTSITVPSGETWKVLLIGAQNSLDNFGTAIPATSPFSINGRSVTLTGVQVGDNVVNFPSVTLTNFLSLAAGSHTLSATGFETSFNVAKFVTALLFKRVG